MENSTPNRVPGLPAKVEGGIRLALLKLHARFIGSPPEQEESGGILAIQDGYHACVRELRQAHIAITEKVRADVIRLLAEWATACKWVATRRARRWRWGEIGPTREYDRIPEAEIYELVQKILRPAIALEQAEELDQGITQPVALSSDPFATKEQREAAVGRAKKNLGSVAAVARACHVDYNSGLRPWVRDRTLAKGESKRQTRIETFLLPYTR
jgi:hypothetical protein